MNNNKEAMIRFITECLEKCTQDTSLCVCVGVYPCVCAIVKEQYLISGLKYFNVKLDRQF